MRRVKQRFFRFIRVYPFIAVGTLILIFLLGGFDQKSAPLIPRVILTVLLFGLVGVVPLIATFMFVVLSVSEDRTRARNLKGLSALPDEDPFDLAHEKMGGFKVVALTGEIPTFTGVTGNTYTNDESAVCTEFPDHVPPANGCECGFYAFKNLEDAKFELSMHPGLFLIHVDLFGIGFEHKYGYRAESQRVNSLKFPKRCMRCKVLPAQAFVKSYKLGYGSIAWWQWSVRCSFCVKSKKDVDKLTIKDMSQQLHVAIN